MLVVRFDYAIGEVAERPRQWQATIVAYDYELFVDQGLEILVYHWHPHVPHSVPFPHLHVGNATTPVDLSKAHLPTGFVGLSAVLRLAIDDLGVEPLRPDWRAVLESAEQNAET